MERIKKICSSRIFILSVGGILGLSICMIIFIINFNKDKKQIINDIKDNMIENWNYADDKVKVGIGYNITIILNNINEWPECVESSFSSIKSLTTNKDTSIKKINKIEFVCKDSELNINSYVIAKNIYTINDENYDKKLEIYNEKKDLIKKSLSDGKKEFKDSYIKKCSDVNYGELQRFSKNYINKYIKVSGYVYEIEEFGTHYGIILTNKKYLFSSDEIYLVYLNKTFLDTSILVNDEVTIYGKFRENQNIESISVPVVVIDGKYADVTNINYSIGSDKL